MNIYLTGYRAAGKSTVAQLLASRLGWECVDTDTLITGRSGRSIQALFAQYGETHFRDLETETVRALAGQKRKVVALGGGAILRRRNRRYIAGSGKVIWLNVPADVIRKRLARDRNTGASRPALTGKDALEEVEHVLRQRIPLYRDVMDMEVRATDRPQRVVDAILHYMQPFLQDP